MYETYENYAKCFVRVRAREMNPNAECPMTNLQSKYPNPNPNRNQILNVNFCS